MTFAAHAAPPAGSASRAGPGGARETIGAFFRDAAAIAEVELRKVARDPTEILTRAVQPTLWLLVFGQVFTRTRAIPTGPLSYLAFMAPGVLAQSVLFSAIFYGIAVIWERDLGIVQKLLVSPSPRASLVLGKAVSAGVRALTQAVIIMVLAYFLGVPLRLDPMSIAGLILAVLLGAALFSTFSFVIACLVKTRERFMGIGQVLTMPLFFASNAIYPLTMMPHWLQLIARVNPLTYLVNALRALMVQGGTSSVGLPVDFAVLAVVFIALIALGARLYPGIIR
ncbi:MAG TPA: ABC transporter permease [Gemmatimonadaceae bacterium]|nr:ABC transporter permease [Gemmatimonadaceae bacterium]